MSQGPVQGRHSVADRVLGHGDEYDGIEEYDNQLPTWWLGILYFTVAWGVIYAVHYHFVAERSQVGDYDAEMALAEERWPEPEAAEVAVTEDAVASGQGIFAQYCVACHGADLRGGIGANLVDAEWVHGGTTEAIQKTIAEGVGTKGMPAWGTVLGPQKVAQVAAYVYAEAEKAGAFAGGTAAPDEPAPTDAAPVEGAPADDAAGAAPKGE